MKNKKGKKLVVLGAMAALLTLIGVSGSQTYAKYVESKEVPSQTATVAKWGFVQTVNVTNLFGRMYEEESENVSVVNDSATTNITVNAVSTTGDVVAPGTKGSMSITIDGFAEVDYELSFSNPAIYDIVLACEDGSYSPLKWTLTGQINGVNAENYNVTGASLTTCLGNFLNSTFHFEAGTVLDVDINLSWEWVYTSNESSGIPGLSCDQCDTILGILASGSNATNGFGQDYSTLASTYKLNEANGTSLKVGFENFTMTLTQVQNQD